MLSTGCVKIKIEVSGIAHLEKDGDLFSSYFPSLNIASQGVNIREAKENLQKSIEMFIEDCLQRGVLEDVLRDCGFKYSEKQQKKEQKKKNTFKILIPIPVSYYSGVVACG
jgi:predicted RNase H-like HicB family nuclease